MTPGTCKPASIVLERSAKVMTSIERPRRSRADRFSGHCEPSLHELMTDPILSRLLASDGVAKEDLEALIRTVRNRLTAE